MTTFDNTPANLLDITPEDIAADWNLALPRRIAFEFVERLQWPRQGLRGMTSDQIGHFKGREDSRCAVSVVRDLQQTVDRNYDRNDPQPAKTEFSAELDCTCGEISSVRVWFVVVDVSVYGF